MTQETGLRPLAFIALLCCVMCSSSPGPRTLGVHYPFLNLSAPSPQFDLGRKFTLAMSTPHLSIIRFQLFLWQIQSRYQIGRIFAKPSVPRASIIWLARAVNVVRPATRGLHIDCACFAKRDCV